MLRGWDSEKSTLWSDCVSLERSLERLLSVCVLQNSALSSLDLSGHFLGPHTPLARIRACMRCACSSSLSPFLPPLVLPLCTCSSGLRRWTTHTCPCLASFPLSLPSSLSPSLLLSHSSHPELALTFSLPGCRKETQPERQEKFG